MFGHTVEGEGMTGMDALDQQTLAALRAVDTPTICNALEIVMGSRTALGFTRSPVIASNPALPPIVGFARTAALLSSEPASDPPETVRARRLDYYAYVAGGPGPTIVVIEDADGHPGLGAFWGEVNVAIHKGLGIAGCLTNGSMRDLGAIDPSFPILAGSVSPSHAFVHVTAFDEPVTVFGLRIHPGDLVHADRHGAVVIDPAFLPDLPRAIDVVARKEAPILTAARAPGFNVETLLQAWGEADDVH
jgi:regulator of RNase E activity RraA